MRKKVTLFYMGTFKTIPKDKHFGLLSVEISFVPPHSPGLSEWALMVIYFTKDCTTYGWRLRFQRVNIPSPLPRRHSICYTSLVFSQRSYNRVEYNSQPYLKTKMYIQCLQRMCTVKYAGHGILTFLLCKQGQIYTKTSITNSSYIWL